VTLLACGHRRLKEYIREHRDAIEEQTRVDVDAVLASHTVRAVEEGALLRSFGYLRREDYYRDASSLRHLPLITTPTLVLLSADDPFLGCA
jgi:predicted alpha/beta-fold hydrolase